MIKFKEDIKVNGNHIEKLLILFIYRLGNHIYYSKQPKFIKMILLLLLNLIRKIFIVLPFHVEIPFQCRIGSGLKLMHPHGIIIHPCTVIGDYCTIFHQVTIGSNEKFNKHNSVARIGNNVYIGCGAKIIGDVFIDDNCKIGANTVVVKDLKEGVIIINRGEVINK